MFKRTKQMLNTIDSLSESISVLRREMDYLRERNTEISKIHRILQNGISGQVTVQCGTYSTYFYKGGKEYKIDKLKIYEPTVTECKSDNIVTVCDFNEDGELHEYIVDLEHHTFIQTE